jgi:UDP-N-acetylglucosamine diphosphorylase / glucose-1-phosphate thymidylyltransferase / UDP-N-acetylgalactosamine diphosphorylase / glucosamine-1-phosphate N-acetyltransferase / galactosamine-1-phosphate N-acetyltransferase
LGAGTSNSNVKNNASEIVLQLHHKKLNAGIKMGVLMGDFSRTAIHTALNTGTVIGVGCNVFSTGLTPKTIANFAWGTQGEKYEWNKAVNDINKWMHFKNAQLSNTEIKKLKTIYHATI